MGFLAPPSSNYIVIFPVFVVVSNAGPAGSFHPRGLSLKDLLH